MKKLNFKLSIVAMAATLIFSSCDDDQGQGNLTEQIELQNESNDYFVIDENGEMISEQEFLAKKDSEIDKKLAEKNVYRSVITDKELDNMSFNNSKREGIFRRVIGRRNRTNSGLPVPNMFPDPTLTRWAAAIGQRTIGDWSGTAPDRRYRDQVIPKLKDAQWRFTTTKRGASSNKRLEGPKVLAAVIEKGKKGKAVSLGGTNTGFTRSESTTTGYSIGAEASIGIEKNIGAKFLGIGADLTLSISFSASTGFSREKQQSKSFVFSYSNGDVVPKGKNCEFQFIGERFERTDRYKIRISIEGGAALRYPQAGTSNYVYHINNPKKARAFFPEEYSTGKAFKNIDVKSEYWRYSKKRKCSNIKK